MTRTEDRSHVDRRPLLHDEPPSRWRDDPDGVVPHDGVRRLRRGHPVER